MQQQKLETINNLPSESGVLALSGYGIRVAVERGHLVTEDGAGAHRRVGRFPRVASGIRRLIVVGHSGTVTLEALRWLHEIDAAFVQIGPDGELIASGAPNAIRDTRVRRGQAVAMYSADALQILRDLIAHKVSGQLRVLEVIEGVKENRAAVTQFHDRLQSATSLEEIRFFESRAAAAYWQAWETIPVRFTKSDARYVPQHWLAFGTRRSVLSASPRKAASPANAILNYLYALLEAEARLAAIAVGCDPAIGIIHADVSPRDSFACDLMEPTRPSVDLHLLELLNSQTFARSDFFELRNGNCRLMPELTRPLAVTTTKWSRAVAPWAERLAAYFAQMSLTPTRINSEENIGTRRHRTPLTQRNRQRRPTAKRPVGKQSSGLTKRCADCGVAMERRTRTYCDTCLPKHAARASRKGVETQAMLRAIGEDKRSSPQVREKHRQHAVAQNALNATWEAKHRDIPTAAVFKTEILPAIRSVPVREIAAASHLSISSCKKIRSGEITPHPRHWDSLRRLISERENDPAD
ncbi:MAG: CRISPR-associated endonuclease Cas1 [Gemmatimonadaceae bacterium]